MKPLDGIRVLDLSRLLPGPYATMVLGDLGARVDKLEDAAGGDYLRRMPPVVGGMNTTFRVLNRGKRSVVLDLKRPEARDAFRRLLPRYDVLVDGFRPRVMERMGLGYEALSALHPPLVYCAITGYGRTGPLVDRAGHDINYLARAGVLGLGGPPEGPPGVLPVQVADVGGGLYGAIGILAALAGRAKTGRGGLVDVSMSEASLAFAVFGFALLEGGMMAGAGGDVLMGGIAPYNTYRTKDGQAMSLGALEPKFWIAFCEAVGLSPDMTALMPGPHQAEHKAAVAAVFAEKTRAEWEELSRRVDCCLEPVLTPAEATADPHLAAREAFIEAGGLRHIRTPAADPRPIGEAPEQGQHTAEVLREAGLGDDEIAALSR